MNDVVSEDGARPMLEAKVDVRAGPCPVRRGRPEVFQSILEKGSWSGEVSGYRKGRVPHHLHLSANLVRNAQRRAGVHDGPVCGHPGPQETEAIASTSTIRRPSSIDPWHRHRRLPRATLPMSTRRSQKLWGARTSQRQAVGKSALTSARSQEEAHPGSWRSCSPRGPGSGRSSPSRKIRTPIAVQP